MKHKSSTLMGHTVDDSDIQNALHGHNESMKRMSVKQLRSLIEEEFDQSKHSKRYASKLIKMLEKAKEMLQEIYVDENQWRPLEAKLDGVITKLIKTHNTFEKDPDKSYMTLSDVGRRLTGRKSRHR